MSHIVCLVLYTLLLSVSLSSLSLQAQRLLLRSLILRSITRMATTCLIRNTRPQDLKTYRKTHHFMCTVGGRERERAYLCNTIIFVYRRVALFEGRDGEIHLKNLSLHSVTSEEEGT